jgi:MFS family permease
LKTKLFKNKAYSQLFWGKFISDIGSQFYLFSLSWYFLDLTESAVVVGYFLSFRLLLYIISAPIGGIISDRLDRIKLLVICDYIRGFVILATFGIVMKTQNQDMILASFYIATFIHGICDALFIPSSTAAIRFVIDKDDLVEGYSVIYMINSVKRILGIMFAGIIYALINIEGILVLNGMSFIISALFESRINVDTKEKHDEEFKFKTIIRDFKIGCKCLLGLKALTWILFISLFSNFIYEPLARNGFTYFFNQVAQTSPAFLSFAAAMTSLGSIAMTQWIKKRDINDLFAHYYSGISFKTMYIVALSANFIVYMMFNGNFIVFFAIHVALLFLDGAIGVYINVPISVFMQREVPSNMIGKVDSFVTTFSMAIMPFSTLMGSYVIDEFGFWVLVMVVSIMSSVLWIVMSICKKYTFSCTKCGEDI